MFNPNPVVSPVQAFYGRLHAHLLGCYLKLKLDEDAVFTPEQTQ